jgi:hypothetical protein
MSDDYQRIELITGTARRRRWKTEQKLRIIEASYEQGNRSPRLRGGMGWRRTFSIEYTSTLDDRSAFILFRHPNETYLVQCRASYDVTRTPPVTSNCYKLQ